MSRYCFLALGTAVALTACSDGPTTPGGDALLSREITLTQLGQTLDSGRARVEIKLVPGSLVAREIEIEQPDELSDEESVRARVAGVTVAAGAGTLALDLGDLEVGFDAATRLRDEEGDLSFDAFVAEIETALAAGTAPSVRAKRPPAAEPQAPEDDTFLATEIRIRNESDGPRLELNVDLDNLRLTDAPPPDAFLTVLGQEIEIRVSTGETELESDIDDRDEHEFDGQVQSVDQSAGTVTLLDGTVIRIVAETRIEHDDDDDGEHLGSLAAVAAALAAGQPVEAEGEGSVESTNPLTIVAREVEFEIEDDDDDDLDDDDEDDDTAVGSEFEAAVTAVDVAGGLVTLAGGRVVRVDQNTVIESDGDLHSLPAAADAVAAGRPVRAEGRGSADATGFLATTVKFEVDD